MTCEDARLALLDAEPHELRGEGDGALPVHLRGCESCGRDAATILAATHALRHAVAARVSTRVAERRHAARKARMRRLAPLALAATLAAAVLLSDALPDPAGDASAVGLYVPEPEVPAAPVVNAATGGDVAVMRTTNPDITVVWTF
ncbi:MAG: hypothetical protein WEF86_00755 [Gemmatimonadota bacterium]